jgi:PAS domain S-box-containing protein
MNALVIEDNEIDREILKHYLYDTFNSIMFASDGKEGLNLFKTHNIDLIITDIQMPGFNGFELIQKVRELNSNVYIIISSSYYDTQNLLKAIELDVDGFLIKPFDVSQFKHIVSKITKLYSHKKIEEKLLTLLNQYKDAVDESLIVSKTNKKGIITYVNDKFCEISGYSKEELIGKPHNIIRHPDVAKEVFKDMWQTILNKKSWKGIIKNKKKNGDSYYVETLIKPLLDENNEIIEFIALRNDITELMKPEKLAKDKLSNLKNPLVIGVKLNDFKNISLVYSEEKIIEIKKKLSEILEKKLKHFFQNIHSYIFDNEYIVFLIEDYEKQNLTRVYEECLDTYLIKFKDFNIYVSVNIAYAYTGDNLIRNVLEAFDEFEEERIICANNLYKLKKEIANENIEMLKKIAEAIKNENIVSFFQPIINNKTLKCEKFESLVRLKGKDKVYSPFFFLDIAKKAGLYPDISKIVLKNSIECVKNCNVSVNINFSPYDMTNNKIVNYFFELVENINPKFITIEILEEDIVTKDKMVKEFLNKCKTMGMKIAIDDFGVGFSNFIRIIDYEIDILKIDGELIKDIDKNRKKRDIVETIVNFAKKENIETVAEFVENKTIFEILNSIGIDYSQGYYFSKPLNKEEAAVFLNNN